MSNIFLSNQKFYLARFLCTYIILSLQFVKGCMFIDDVDKTKDNIPIELVLQNMTYLYLTFDVL